MNGQLQGDDQLIPNDLRESLIPSRNATNISNIEDLKRTTVPLMTAVAFSNILYTSLQSFYPIYIQSNFPLLQSVHFGIILATFEVANLITSLFLGFYIGKVKRKNLIIQSYFVLLLSTISFIGLPLLRSDQYVEFFILSLVFRSFQGMASASIQICAYSFATNEMKLEKDRYIGYVEAATGMGDMLGPAIGGFIYDIYGFSGAFIAFGVMLFVGIIYSGIMIPKSLNVMSHSLSRIEETEENEKTDSKKSLSDTSDSAWENLAYKDFFMNYQCLIILVSACLAVVFTLYVECILAIQLHTVYQVSNSWLGGFFLLSSITYVIGAPLSSYLSEVIHRRYVIFIAFALMIFQSLFVGPSQLLGLPESLSLIVFGLGFVGLALSMALVPLLSELIEILEDMDQYDPVQISDMTAGLFNSMFNLGNLVAPLIAGVLNDNFGYRYTCDFMLVTSLLFVLLFYFTMIFKNKHMA